MRERRRRDNCDEQAEKSVAYVASFLLATFVSAGGARPRLFRFRTSTAPGGAHEPAFARGFAAERVLHALGDDEHPARAEFLVGALRLTVNVPRARRCARPGCDMSATLVLKGQRTSIAFSPAASPQSTAWRAPLGSARSVT
jgi:hypothetical protein